MVCYCYLDSPLTVLSPAQRVPVQITLSTFTSREAPGTARTGRSSDRSACRRDELVLVNINVTSNNDLLLGSSVAAVVTDRSAAAQYDCLVFNVTTENKIRLVV